MSNIQLFEQAFAIDFPVEVADMVLQRMSDLYGSAFTKNFEVYADEELRLLKKRWVFRENSRHRRLCAYAQRVEQKVMVNKVSQVIACVEGDKVYTQARITAFGLTRLTALVAAAGLLNK